MTSEPVLMSGLFMSGVNIAGLPVKCGSCGGKFHALTERFRPEPPMRGSYLKMIARYRSWGWYAFPESEWVVGDNVQCPQCGCPYKMEYVVEQVMAFVNESLGVEVHGDKIVGASGGTETAGDIASEGGAQDTEGSAQSDPLEQDKVQADEEVGSGDSCGGDPCGDGAGIYATPEGNLNTAMTVMRMTADGITQAQIAQTCNLSVYMVRQIQNGRKV